MTKIEGSIHETLIEKATANYSSATWLRTLIIGASGAVGITQPIVPAVVGAMDVALTTFAQKVAGRRLSVLCELWEAEIKEVEQSQISKVFIGSEEFLDLLVKAWEATKQTRHEDKIRLYAKILVGSVKEQDRTKQSPEDYLSVIAELSIRELSVARALYKQQKALPENGEFVFKWLTRIGAYKNQDKEIEWQNSLAQQANVPIEDMQFILLRLQRSGMVNEISGAITDYTGGIFTITDTFRKMMAYINLQSA